MADKPLKTLLELITKYFLESFEKNKKLKMTGNHNMEATKIFIKGSRRKESKTSHLDVYDLSDEDAGESSAVSDSSITHRTGNSKPSYNNKERPRAVHDDYKKSENGTGSSSTYENEVNLTREPKTEASRVPECLAEAQRPKSSRIVRGMMSGPIASAQEESLRKRGQRRSSASFQSVQAKDEPLTNGRIGSTGGPTNSPPNPALQLGKEFSAKVLVATSSNSTPRSPSITKQPPSMAEEIAENATDAYRDFKTKISLGAQEKHQKPSKKSEELSSSRRWVHRVHTIYNTYV
ncbi:hypothetical protein GDO78_020518 [Eleutherodactylus coqui]|uniref:Uncharacterized protein n=1 Tax=Eleutherodactylus coqui TaxID=57060 RepID=A0A8J6EAA6_ELECQ|nr:hypothetical protein GDO78_020518 [Eleutherodactylus coqui]